jgi:hypothetical protein
MQLRARSSDWHSGNPDVRPALWLGAVAGAFVLCILVAGLVGAAANGDGSPFLG